MASIVCGAAGSHTTRSASAPGTIAPLRGYSPNSFAGAVATSSTNRQMSKRPCTTPASYITSSRSSMPGTPLGTLGK